MARNKLVSVVIVTKDRRDDLEECVESFLKSSYKPLEILVVDNASRTPVKNWLTKKHNRVKIVHSNKNLGAAGGRNLGLENAKGDYVLFSDDDAVADRKMISKLVEVFEQKENAGIVQPVIFDKKNKSLFQGAGHDISLLTGRIRPWGIDTWGRGEKDKGQYKGIREVAMCGCVWMVKKEVFEKIGGYDEDYFIPYEDSDFSIRARKVGYKLYCNYDAKSYHPIYKNTEMPRTIEFLGISSPERAFRVSRNKIIFMKKHSPFPKNLIFFFVFLPILSFIHSLVILLAGRLGMLTSYWKGIFSGFKYIFNQKKGWFFKTTGLAIISYLATYIAVKPSLDLSLFGDDWLVFYDLIESAGAGKALDPTIIQGYFAPYAYPHYYMGVIRYFWMYNSFVYYFISYVLRSLASLSLGVFILGVTGSFLAAAITSVFFSFSAAGIESTNWVFNAPVYLSITFLSFSFLILLKNAKNIFYYTASLILLTLSIMMFPQRMHGAIPLYFLILSIQLIFNYSKTEVKQYLLKVILFVSTIYFLVRMQTFGAPEGLSWLIGQAKMSLSSFGPFILSTITATLGNLVIPDTIWEQNGISQAAKFLLGGSTVTPRMGYLTGIFILSTLFLARFRKKKRITFFTISVATAFLISLFYKFVVVGKLEYFTNLSHIMSTFVGIYLFSWSLSYFAVLEKKEKFLPYFIIFIWPAIIISVSWMRNGFLPVPTILRYMIVAGAGTALLAGYILSGIKKPQLKFLFISILAIPMVFNLITTYSYLNHLATIRNDSVYDNLWNQLWRYFEEYDFAPTEKPVVVYFEGDYERLYNIFFFGFPPRLAIKYDIHDNEREKMPIAIDNFGDLVLAAKGGGMVSHRGESFIPPERIYAFRLEGEELVDIKDKTMKRLYETGYLPDR